MTDYSKQPRPVTDYAELCAALKGLISGCPHMAANLANASALLAQFMQDINWAGFYILGGEQLVLGPFQGKPACIEIPLGRGVCGTAAAEKRTVLVPDVHEFPGHIACDAASRSEIVVPIFRFSKVFGVLDIDSPNAGRFSEEDQAGLEAFVKILEEELSRPKAPEIQPCQYGYPCNNCGYCH